DKNPTRIDSAAFDGAKIISVAAKGSLTVALDEFGNLWWFGYKQNSYDYYATVVPGKVNLAALACAKPILIAFGSQRLIVDDQDRLWAWNTNNSWQQINTENLGTAKITSISASSHALILDDQGKLWAMGSNYSGQLGTGGVPYSSNDLIEVNA